MASVYGNYQMSGRGCTVEEREEAWKRYGEINENKKVLYVEQTNGKEMVEVLKTSLLDEVRTLAKDGTEIGITSSFKLNPRNCMYKINGDHYRVSTVDKLIETVDWYLNN